MRHHIIVPLILRDQRLQNGTIVLIVVLVKNTDMDGADKGHEVEQT